MQPCQIGLRAVGPLVAFFALLQGATQANDPQLQGTWVMVSMEHQGKVSDGAKGSTITIAGNKMNWTWVAGNERRDSVIKVDATKTPKHFDQIEKFEDKEETVLGIYQIDGDTLRICIPLPDKDGSFAKAARPTAMDSKAGTIATYKREKK